MQCRRNSVSNIFDFSSDNQRVSMFSMPYCWAFLGFVVAILDRSWVKMTRMMCVDEDRSIKLDVTRCNADEILFQIFLIFPQIIKESQCFLCHIVGRFLGLWWPFWTVLGSK
mmetsp:Transcript_18717/g.43329  ORF Transcript_18717/g.43329 Transcript_18717/m.43329 type:complete len:112 (+) Transcript_18717:21-356(+)